MSSTESRPRTSILARYRLLTLHLLRHHPTSQPPIRNGVMRIHNQLMGPVIDMDILAEHHDLILVAKQRRDLF